MKLRYTGLNVGPISLTDISSSITAGPGGINFTNIVAQNQIIPPGPTVIELQDSDEVIKSFKSGQLNSYITSGNFVVDVPPLTSAEFIPGDPSDWELVPPNDIYEALDQAAFIASSYRNGTATLIKLADGSAIGDMTHHISDVFANAVDAATAFNVNIAGVSKVNTNAVRTLVDQDLDVTGFVTLSADPVNPLHAVTKQYADNLLSSMDFKESVRAATTTNISLVGLAPIDGVTIIPGNRVLVKDQTAAKDNGIYVASAGVWSRSVDADTGLEVTPSTFVFVEEGTSNQDTGWVLITDDSFVLGTDPLSFSKFTENLLAGAGLVRTGNTLSVGGLITAGTWQATTITVAYGGTGNTSFTNNKFLAYDGTKLVSTVYDSSSFLSSAVGTTNVLAKFTGPDSLGNSVISDLAGVVTMEASEISGKADNSTNLGSGTRRFATVFMASVIDIKPGSTLQIGHASNDLLVHSSGRVLIGTNVDDTTNQLQVTGGAKISGTMTSGGVVLSISLQSSSYSLLSIDYTVEFDCTGGPLIATLPSAPVVGQIFNVCKNDVSSNSLTLLGNGHTIDGQPTLTATVQYFNWTVQYNGIEWRVL